jgi:hypothetical protein
MTSFDANGDIEPSAFTIYGLDPAATDGADWYWERQILLDAP